MFLSPQRENPGLGAQDCVGAERKMTRCATKNTEYQMERLSCFPFHVCLSFLLFLLYSIAFMLFRFWTCFWQRSACWLEQMLCLDCSGIVLVWLQQRVCEHIQRLRWKWVFFPYGFSSLWLGPKGQRWYPAHPACPSVSVEGPSSRLRAVPCGCGHACLSKHLLAKSQCTVWSGDDGQLTLWSLSYLGCRCSPY